jgi:hypothetical protein
MQVGEHDVFKEIEIIHKKIDKLLDYYETKKIN